MLVKHLIRELSKCDPEMQVITEGCDCNGESYAVTINTPSSDEAWPAYVYIERAPYGSATPKYSNFEDTPNPLT